MSRLHDASTISSAYAKRRSEGDSVGLRAVEGFGRFTSVSARLLSTSTRRFRKLGRLGGVPSRDFRGVFNHRTTNPGPKSPQSTACHGRLRTRQRQRWLPIEKRKRNVDFTTAFDQQRIKRLRPTDRPPSVCFPRVHRQPLITDRSKYGHLRRSLRQTTDLRWGGGVRFCSDIKLCCPLWHC